MYRDQFGEFVCRYWGLKGYWFLTLSQQKFWRVGTVNVAKQGRRAAFSSAAGGYHSNRATYNPLQSTLRDPEGRMNTYPGMWSDIKAEGTLSDFFNLMDRMRNALDLEKCQT